MPSAVTAVFGADSTPLAAELARVEAMAARGAKNITSKVAEGSRTGLLGMMRSMAMIGKELAEGKSISIRHGSTFIREIAEQFIGNSSERKGAERIIADAYSEMALGAEQKAVASVRKAQTSEMAFAADVQETEATLNAAIADREKAQSAELCAIATRQKAIAATQAAEAAEAEAVATGSAAVGTGLFSAGLAIAALAAGVVYEHIWGVKSVLEELSMKTPDLKDDYIPLLKRHINDARNAQREVTLEVNKTVTAYNSAAEAAKRTADNTKEHYSHLKKMLDLQKQTELDRAYNPSQKEAIEKKYSDLELKLQRDQQNEQLANKYSERTNLLLESRTKLAQANAIHVRTKEEDSEMLSQFNQNASAAEAFLKGGGRWEEFKKQAAIQLGGASEELINQTEAGGMASANAMIKKRNDISNEVAGNDEIRKTKEDLLKQAATAAGTAAKLGLEIPNDVKNNATANADSAAEAAAKLAEEKAKDLKTGEKGFGNLTSAQRLGAYAATPPDFKVQTALLQQIARNTGAHPNPMAPPGARPTSYGGVPKHHMTSGGVDVAG